MHKKPLCALNMCTEFYSRIFKAFMWSENTETEIWAFHLHLELGKFNSTLLINTFSL